MFQPISFTDGAADPVVIEIPKRSYHVVFRPREQATDPAPAGARRSRLLPVLGIALAALAAACVWLALENAKLRTAAGPASPSVDRLWRALAASGREVTVVMADANLMILSDLMGGHTVTLFEYRAQNFPAALLSEYIADPKLRAEAAHIAGTHLTPFQDADVVRTLLPVGLRRRLAMNVVYARDFRLQGNPNNVILLGHKRGNPWVELFEPRMNFRYHYTPEGGAFRAMLVNESLQPGEEKVYPVEFGQHGYADVAYLPKPQGEGAALLVTGTDMSSINAGGHFLTDERAVGKLFEVLKLGGGAVPYFEVLLKTRLLVNTEQGYEIVAHRVVKP